MSYIKLIFPCKDQKKNTEGRICLKSKKYSFSSCLLNALSSEFISLSLHITLCRHCHHQIRELGINPWSYSPKRGVKVTERAFAARGPACALARFPPDLCFCISQWQMYLCVYILWLLIIINSCPNLWVLFQEPIALMRAEVGRCGSEHHAWQRRWFTPRCSRQLLPSMVWLGSGQHTLLAPTKPEFPSEFADVVLPVLWAPVKLWGAGFPTSGSHSAADPGEQWAAQGGLWSSFLEEALCTMGGVLPLVCPLHIKM